jgi:hypothetical protein
MIIPVNSSEVFLWRSTFVGFMLYLSLKVHDFLEKLELLDLLYGIFLYGLSLR